MRTMFHVAGGGSGPLPERPPPVRRRGRLALILVLLVAGTAIAGATVAYGVLTGIEARGEMDR
jgi:hypothetical protein